MKETQSQRIFEDYDFEDSFDENPLPNMGRVQGEESEDMEDEYVDLPDDMSIAEFLAIPEDRLVAKFLVKRETLLRNQWKRAEIKRRKALTPAEHAAEREGRRKRRETRERIAREATVAAREQQQTHGKRFGGYGQRY